MGGFPAARITDTTAHGGKVVVGFPTVLINNLPASRIGDMHVCPMFTGPVPHVGGPFVLGAFNVIVGGVPQSRVTDMLICIGPPDILAMGSPNVIVGMEGAMGMFGLVVGGLLSGLKNFLSGYPKSDLENGSIVTQYNSQITITGSPQYQAKVVSDLNKFLATPTGQRWSAAYAKTGRHITVQPIDPSMDQNNGYTQAGGDGAYPKADGKPGDGADSTISYNASRTSQYTAADGTTQTKEGSDTLGHEMIHGLHNGQGDNLAGNTQPSPFDNEEESQTIGVNGHDSDTITERTLDDDEGHSYRPDHDSITSSTYQDSNDQWHQSGTDASGNPFDNIVPTPPGGGAGPNH